MERAQARAFGIAIGGTVPVLVAGLLVGARSTVGQSGVALILLLVVVAAATVGGVGAGFVATVTAAFSFAFFHAPPYQSLSVRAHEDAVTLGWLVVVGFGCAVLSGRAHTLRTDLRVARLATSRVRDIAGCVADGHPSTDVLLLAQAALTELLGLRSCRFETPPFVATLPRVERNGSIAGSHEHRFTGGDFELPRGSVELAVHTRGRLVGRFVLVPRAGRGVGQEQRLVAVAIADQVGAAFVPQRST